MKKGIFKKSLKNKMIICFTSIGVVPIIILSSIYSIMFDNVISKSVIQETQTNLKYIMANVDKQLEMAGKISLWFSSNKHLDTLLTKQYANKLEANIEVLTFNKYAQEYILNSFVGNNISKALIIGNNGLQFQIGDETSVIDSNIIKQQDWFKTYKNTQVTQLVRSPDKYGRVRDVFPLAAAIVNNIDGETIGWNIIFYKSNLISDVFKQFNISQKDELFIINSNGQCLGHTQPQYIGTNLLSREYVKDILHNDTYKNQNGYIEKDIDGIKYVINYYKHPYKELILMQTSSLDLYYSGKTFFMNITIITLIVTVIASIGSVIFLSFRLTKPIKNLLNRLNKIAGGDFEIDLEIEGEDEIGIIGKDVNKMVIDIKYLVDKLIQEERVKKDLEFKMLQNQINPHFLYNTLNCIKWMATIQNATGIRDMVGAMARILQSISKGTADEIPMYEEFLIVDDYIEIQNVRYNGKINLEYHIEESYLTTASIIKFTLQPIIENAIFHGIEPKIEAGKIDVFLKKEKENLKIIVRDDGVGISKEKLRQICSENTKRSKKTMNSIGIKNVDERLKLHYGEKYGLSVISEEGKYTEVNIVIPYKQID